MGALQTNKITNTLVEKGKVHKLVKYWIDLLRLLKAYGVFETILMV